MTIISFILACVISWGFYMLLFELIAYISGGVLPIGIATIIWLGVWTIKCLINTSKS